MHALHSIDTLLDRITMYKLLVYGLRAIFAIAVLFALAGALSLPVSGMFVSIAILIPVCFGSNWLLARVYGVATNNESWNITALILWCILPQATTIERAVYIGLAGLLAIASKYLIVWRNKHIFNPAAFGAAVLGAGGLLYASWWIGNPTLAPFTIIFGLLIARKTRRLDMVLVFVGASLLVSLAVALVQDQPIFELLKNVVLSGPLIFLGTVMLTEPSTMPPTRYFQLLYAVLVAILFAAGLHLGTISITPQLALLAGNIFAFITSYKARVQLVLKSKSRITPQSYDFIFTSNRPLVFMAGQYMEYTLPLVKADWRGNRRTFSIASSPTETELHIGIKFYERGSAFKQQLLALEPGAIVQAGQLAGDFVLPADRAQKLVWIAGGIGITPFRSMAQYLIDSDQQRDIILLYAVKDEQELAYKAVFVAAAQQGIKLVPVYERLTVQHIQDLVPDYAQRQFYLSGPQAMVETYRATLRSLHIPRSHIKTDHFTGY